MTYAYISPMQNKYITGKYVKSYLPQYVAKSFVFCSNKLIYLRYVNISPAGSNYRYVVRLGCMSVMEWLAYIVGKHETLFEKVNKYLVRKHGSSYTNAKTAVINAINFAATIASIAERFSDEDVSETLKAAVLVLKIVKGTLAVLQDVSNYLSKYLDKEDKYIKRIIEKRKSSEIVMILFDRTDYSYSQRSYQKGVYYVWEKGWFATGSSRVY